MKRIVALTAVAVALTAGAASAYTANSDAALNGVYQFAPNADLTAISTQERAQLISVLVNGDSDTDKRDAIRTILQ